MKTYNALSKSFTDEVKDKMIKDELTIDEAFTDVKNGEDFPNPSEGPGGEDIDIDTLKRGDGINNSYYYVNLGLPSGTKWATCNVGAGSPEEYGKLFQFGNILGCEYDGENTSVLRGTVAPVTLDELDSTNDAATNKMGDEWQTPTLTQLRELNNDKHTDRQIVTIKDTNGVLYTSKTNGKQMFIPFGGFWDKDALAFNSKNSYLYMWSRNKNNNDSATTAYMICGFSTNDNRCEIYDNTQLVDYGLSVRAVLKPNNT